MGHGKVSPLPARGGRGGGGSAPGRLLHWPTLPRTHSASRQRPARCDL